MSVMRVVVDPDLCEGNGRCEAAAEAVFQLDEDKNIAVVLVAEPGEELRGAVERAARVCPRGAIRIEE